MPNQDPPFFVIAEGARLFGPLPTRDRADTVVLTYAGAVDAVVLSAAELATLRDRLAMMELRS